MLTTSAPTITVPLTRATLRAFCRDHALTFRSQDGEHRVTYAAHHPEVARLNYQASMKRREDCAAYCNDLEEAFANAQAMACVYIIA